MNRKNLIMLILIAVMSLSLSSVANANISDGADTITSNELDTTPKVAVDEEGNNMIALDKTDPYTVTATVTIEVDVTEIFQQDGNNNNVDVDYRYNRIEFREGVDYYTNGKILLFVSKHMQNGTGSTYEEQLNITEDAIRFETDPSTGKTLAYITVEYDVESENEEEYVDGLTIDYRRQIHDDNTGGWNTEDIVSSKVDLKEAVNNAGGYADPENADPSGMIGGSTANGSVEKPFKITIAESTPPGVCVIHYKDLPFYFCLDGGKEGTYLLELDEQEKTVTFLWNSTSKNVGYIPEHNSNSETYDQTGVTPLNISSMTSAETVPTFLIKEYSTRLLDQHAIKGYKLKNGFANARTSIASFIQKPNAYVFVNRTQKYRDSHGTLKENDVIYEFALEPNDEKAGWLESMITRFLADIGDKLLTLMQKYLGANLTIDGIIFNEYEPTVIDLEGNRGVLGQISGTINTLFTNFQTIAGGIYLALILYVGIRILMDVGTGGQARYRQHITNLVVGLVLLFVGPMFFKYVPTITNEIIQRMASSKQPAYTYYNIDEEKLKKWGFDEATIEELLGTSGEDTRTVWVEALTGKRDDLLNAMPDLEEKSEEYNALATQIAQDIHANYNDPDDEAAPVAAIMGLVTSYVDGRVSRDTEIDRQSFNNLFGTLFNENGDRVYQYAEAYYHVQNTRKIIDTLNEVIPALEKDVMGEMRMLAGQTGRFAYALVWYILFFQMIILLCMYYKRVIVMAILLIIYPLAAMTYPLDKVKDGKAQSLETWYKEFTVNILVQIAHAVVYVVLVEAGRNIYVANSNNWLFFLLAILFLFPAERLLRAIFGLKGSTINNLQANVAGSVAGVATAVSVGRNTARMVNQKVGITQGGKDAKAKEQKKQQDAKDARDKKDRQAQARADQKHRQRQTKALARRRAMAVKANMSAARKAAYGVMNTAAQARDIAYKAGNAGRTLRGQYRRLQDSRAASFARGAWKVARSGAGIAYGASRFVTEAGKGGGLGAAYTTGTMEGRLIGGFKKYNATPSAIDNRINRSGAAGSGSAAASSSAGGSTTGGYTSSGGTTYRSPGSGSSTGGLSGGSSSGGGNTRINTRVTQNTQINGGNSNNNNSNGNGGSH
ncbi:MAG: cell envelope integrity protein TolA [Clostridia bacterium]|nr:cell envelope integrity protein TolA [Clostridia bacterium]